MKNFMLIVFSLALTACGSSVEEEEADGAKKPIVSYDMTFLDCSYEADVEAWNIYSLFREYKFFAAIAKSGDQFVKEESWGYEWSPGFLDLTENSPFKKGRLSDYKLMFVDENHLTFTGIKNTTASPYSPRIDRTSLAFRIGKGVGAIDRSRHDFVTYFGDCEPIDEITFKSKRDDLLQVKESNEEAERLADEKAKAERVL